jgi:hypothetical protein
MRRTTFLKDGKEHIKFMVSDDGKPKGLQKVLEECGLIKKNSSLLKKQMVAILAAH